MNKTVSLLLVTCFFGTLIQAQPELPQPGSASVGAGPAMPGIGSGPIQGPQPFPPMTEAEMARWQEEVDTEIAKFVSTLPADQQEQFYKDVDELTKVMSNMSDTELAQFIEDVFVTPEMVAQPELIQPQPEIPAVPEKQPTPVKEEQPSEDINKAIKMLTNIITRTERFLRRTTQIPELTGKIEHWVAKDTVKEWQADLTWSTLKKEIELLDKKIRDVKEVVDPKTKQHRYIADLIKDEALYNNLNKLSTQLTKFEPKVEAAEFGLKSVSKESRSAIKELLGAFAEAIYTLNVNTELSKLIEKYEPRAKTLREEEETAHKKAVEESKKPRTEAQKREAVAGGKGKGAGYTPGGYAQYPTGGGYYPSTGYTPGYNAPQVPSYEAPTGSGYEPVGGRGGGARAPELGIEGEPERGKKGETGKVEPKKGGEEKPKEKEEKPAEDVKADKQIKNIEKNLDTVAETIEDNPLITDLEKHLMGPDPVDPDLVTRHIPLGIVKNVKKATKEVKAFKLQLNTLSPAQKSHYNKKIKPIVLIHKDDFKKLHDQLDAAIIRKNRVSPEKRYAYFGDITQKEAAIKADETLADITPINLGDALQALDDWNEAIRDYSGR